jgi:hypothetical protein
MSAVTEGLLRYKLDLETEVNSSLARAPMEVIDPSIKYSFEMIGNGSAINRTIE